MKLNQTKSFGQTVPFLEWKNDLELSGLVNCEKN